MNKRKLPLPRTISVKLTEENAKKLEEAASVTGLTKSAVVRQFIDDGQVQVFYGTKTILQKMAHIENNMNQYCHHVLQELDSLRENIYYISNMISTQVFSHTPPFRIVLDAEKKLNDLKKDLRTHHENYSKELNDCVHPERSSQF